MTPGTRIGPYEITSALGEGGMGKVYRAIDTNLKRAVAIKVLPESVAADPDRLVRFQREAEVLAALNHPNIAHLHGVEKAGGSFALVMEIVDGPTLAERLANGPVPLDEAVSIARQMAEALEAAHEQRIVHRDLKPANVKIREDGTVKVLDFGLAKALDPVGAAPNLSQSPTVTSPAMTQAGIVLGTAPYMSPEQARGKPADKRSDVWSFGCVLYEMLTGRRAFDGDDVADTLAAVLRGEPDWQALPADVPAPIRALLRRCLEKDRRSRISDLAAARFALDLRDLAVVPTASRSAWRPVAIAALVFIASTAIALAVWMSRQRSAPSSPVVRFAVSLPQGDSFNGPASGLALLDLSPDGRNLVYAGSRGLYLRSMAEPTPKAIPGTDASAQNPVFSPDGESVAFFSSTSNTGGPFGMSRGVIKRVRVTGGTPLTLCESAFPFGLSWGANGLLFAEAGRGVMRVPAEGGTPELLVPVNDNEVAAGPQLLPGGRAVLFTHATGASDLLRRQDDFGNSDWNQARIVVQSLETGARQTLIEGGSGARYAAGYIVYAVAGTLRAVAFDVGRLSVTGEATPLLEGVARTRFRGAVPTGAAHFAMSSTGALAYISGPVSAVAPPRDLGLYERTGAIRRLDLPPMLYEFPRVSPDGQQLAVSTMDSTNRNVWVYELSGRTPLRRLTLHGNNRSPVWSDDGRDLAFQSDHEGDRAIFTQRADGSRPAQRLTRPEPKATHVPQAWSPGGQYLLFSVETDTGFSLATLSVPAGKVERIVELPSSRILPAAVFSPNGRWIAYQSEEGRESRVFVLPFPATGAVYQLPSAAGHPRWANDGTQLFVSQGPSIHSMPVSYHPTFTFGPRSVVIRGIPLGAPQSARNYDVLANGNQFVGVAVAEGYTPVTAGAIRQIDVILNWLGDLQTRAPVQ